MHAGVFFLDEKTGALQRNLDPILIDVYGCMVESMLDIVRWLILYGFHVGKYTSPMDDMGEDHPRIWIRGHGDRFRPLSPSKMAELFLLNGMILQVRITGPSNGKICTCIAGIEISKADRSGDACKAAARKYRRRGCPANHTKWTP